MEITFGSRLKHAWNAFMNRDPTGHYRNIGMGYSYRPDRIRMTRGNERSIVTSVYNRIALDVAAITIQHVRLDQDKRFISVIDSGLNNCLNVEANIDQTGRGFIQDVVMSMFDEGCVAIVPVDTTDNPVVTGSYDITTMRTGEILEWYPAHVKVRLYNDRSGKKEDILLAKSAVGIIENPLYAVINEPNSTMQRLIRKLNLLDVIDEQSGSGKLDLIIQLPYVIKTEARRKQAENRRKDIEMQLAGSKYGIAYTDGTERITQLNRAVDNNLMAQIEYLTSMLYSQLGITQSILDGTADEKTMLSYHNRTIEPIVSAIVDEMKRKFLTKTARSQLQSIASFRDPFKLVPVSEISEIADKMTRNEIMTSNEIRQAIGMKPSDDPKAEELRNKNLNQSGTETAPVNSSMGMSWEEYDAAVQELDGLDAQIDELEELVKKDKALKHYASPYYDPVKAHEYYMRNRELKGRRSTTQLNDEGRNAARYVKEQLSNERKGRVDANKAHTDSVIEGLREKKAADIEAHKAVLQTKIDALKDYLDNMDSVEKSDNKEIVYDAIASLREENKQERVRLQEEFKASNSSLRAGDSAERSRLKEEYDEKYLQELDKIRSTPRFQKKSKK